jgi:2,3-bisphosphoglycerate-dependent phosphoglycerate mutase
VLVAAHGNSLRALIMHLDGMTSTEVVDLNLPTGEPLVYELNDDMRPTARKGPGGVKGRYLDPKRALASAQAVAKQGA